MPTLLKRDLPDASSGSPVLSDERAEDKVRSGTFEVAARAEHAEESPDARSLLRFKEDAIATLVHDLSAPLAAIVMNLDFALAELSEDAVGSEVRGALAESRLAGAKTLRAIRNLLDVARGHEGRLVPRRSAVEPAPLVQRIVDAHAAEATSLGVSLLHEVTVEGPLFVDAGMLGRVVGSLVEHALRHTAPGGAVGIKLRTGRRTGAALIVGYDGRPVPDAVRSLVFDAEATADSTSSAARGFGLFFCRLAAEAHGGSFEIADGPGDATCFRVELPEA